MANIEEGLTKIGAIFSTATIVIKPGRDPGDRWWIQRYGPNGHFLDAGYGSTLQEAIDSLWEYLYG